jgi:hypothetical protein
MPYPGPQSWHDLPTTDTPITAARLGHMEDGINAGPFGYGIDKWGFAAASIHPLMCRSTTGYGGTTTSSLSLARTIIPAGVAITNVVSYVSVVGSGVAGSGPNAYAVYEVSGTTATLAQSTANDSTLWTTLGWRSKALASPVASQGSDREVILAIGIALGTPPSIGASIMGTSLALNKNVAGTDLNLTYFITGQASWPSTINLATAAKDSGFVFLGVT